MVWCDEIVRWMEFRVQRMRRGVLGMIYLLETKWSEMLSSARGTSFPGMMLETLLMISGYEESVASAAFSQAFQFLSTR